MTRTQSVRRGWNTRHRNRIARLMHRGTIPHGILMAAMCPFVLSLGSTAVYAGDTGMGIGLKIGAQTIDDPITLDKITRARFELEVSSPVMLDDHFDLAFTFGGSSLGTLDDYYAEEVDSTLIEEFYTDHLSVLDVRVAARLYPFGYDKNIRPYVGAGIGYFWFLDRWEYEYAETFEDPHFPGTFITLVDDDEGTDTMAHGFFPFVLAGVAIPLGSNADLMFEFQYDIDKKESGFDLSGPIYMFGGRIRF
jgi:hypothetical protein